LRIEEEIQVEGLPVNAQQKVFVKKVNVTNATLLTQQEIADIIVPFENQELTLAQMQKAVAMITDAYRRRGYVTSRATLPPQKIVDGVLEILIVEGTTGDIQVKGNKFFRSELIRNAVHLQKGRLFNYNDLRKDLQRLNEKPDRTVKAVLVPGKEPGSTDIILEVSDRLPVHFRTEWDNYGSRYVRKERFTESVRHNNLLGFDDMLYLQAQSGESQDYMLFAMQYIIPVADRTKIGFAASDSKVDLGEEYADLNARGKSKMFELFAVQELYMSDDLRVNANAGFDYLDSFSFQLGSEQSRDRLRTLKLGFDADYSDAWDGRTIISPESSFGLGSIMAGLKDKDSRASRSGAGGKYIKHSMNLLRFQRLPHQLAFLWKNQAQVSRTRCPRRSRSSSAVFPMSAVIRPLNS
jgi:hemolysin activation/secretion protein